ncbi:MAG: TlpA family protein disulfide reductase [Acidobacteria bacterium]|nr:TlpA family protein disulfide reductase [Acidobacteriota bacterium]
MQAPEFTLNDLDGRPRALRDLLTEGPLLLAFFKIDCPTCQLTFPYLQRLADRGGRRVVAISQDDAEGTREFHSDFKIALPTLIDSVASRYAVSRAYGLTHVPSLFDIGAGGEIAWSGTGFDKAVLENLAGGGLFSEADRVPVFKPG